MLSAALKMPSKPTVSGNRCGVELGEVKEDSKRKSAVFFPECVFFFFIFAVISASSMF